MNTLPSPKALEKRAFRAQSSDGLMEILLGPTLLICSLTLSRPYLVIFLVLVPFFMPRLATHLQARWVHPRIGYAKLPHEDQRGWAGGVLLFLAGVFALFILALAVAGRIAEVEAWRKWTPALAGMLCSGGFLYLAQRSGLVRHYLYVAVVLAGGLAFSFLPAEPPYLSTALYLMTLGALMMTIGIVLFVHFLRTHPRLAAEASDGEG